MNKKLTQCLFLFMCTLSFVGNVSSQKSFQKAEKQFELKAFDLAIENYKKTLKNDKKCTDCKFKIAEAYRLTNRSIDAANWYEKMANDKNLPNRYFLSYGKTLKKMGRYDEAQALFATYQLTNEELGEHFSLSCDYAKVLMSDNEKYRISLFKGSSDQSEYGPTFFNDKLVYASFRNDFIRDYKRDGKSNINTNSSQLFISEKGRLGDKRNTDFLLSDQKEKFQIGAVAYAESNDVCVYTKNNYAHAGMEVFPDDADMHVYLAKVDNKGRMYDEIPFEYNEVGYSTGFPTLNYDGKALYFASNRPGGFGGYDLYVSYNKNGIWTYPENLGEKVNSVGNEITPFLKEDKLYFSSDFHHGLGGFDIFMCGIVGGDWDFPVNQGNGVNSPEDDIYPAFDPLENIMYVTSNRLGGKGQHDIYMAIKVIEHQTITLSNAMLNSTKDVASTEIPAAVNIENFQAKQTTPVNLSNQGKVSLVSDKTEVKTKINKTESGEVIPEPVKLQDKKTSMLDQSTDPSITEPINNSVPPAAVSLVNLSENNARDNAYGVSFSEAMQSMNGVKKVAFGEVITNPTKVYFIQLAALYSTKGNILPFKSLVDYGNIYKTENSSVTKIKLGYFYDMSQANQVLSQIKNKGYADAFITHEALNSNDMELVVSSGQTDVSYGESYTSGYTTGTQYKVRLAAYEDPIWFDVNKVKDIGMIEQWSKRDWTIFVLSGFDSFEKANEAKIKALNRGFADAEVVLDNNGVLETIKSN